MWDYYLGLKEKDSRSQGENWLTGVEREMELEIFGQKKRWNRKWKGRAKKKTKLLIKIKPLKCHWKK